MPRTPPETLQRFITQPEWDSVVLRFQNIENDSKCTACAIEWGVCCCFGLFCIFCCHDCVWGAVMENEMERFESSYD